MDSGVLDVSEELAPKKPKIEEEEDDSVGEEEDIVEEDEEKEDIAEEDEEEDEEEDDWESDDLEIQFRYIRDKDIRREAIDYHRELFDKGPYDISYFPKYRMVCRLNSLNFEEDPDILEKAIKAAQFAVEQNNNDTGSQYEFKYVKRVNYYRMCGFLFYLTFVVTDQSGEEETWKARVMDHLLEKVSTLVELNGIQFSPDVVDQDEDED